MIDKLQCLFQGRPPLLRRINFDVPLAFLDEYDELDLLQDTTYGRAKHRTGIPSFNVSLLMKLCELSLIIERILCELYSESQVIRRAHDQRVLDEIKSRLSIWRTAFPPQLDCLLSPNSAVILPHSYCLLYVLAEKHRDINC